MSAILVNKTSQSSQSAPGSFADMTDMAEASINVGSASSIVLLIASFDLDQSGSADHVAECQFAVDDTLEGPSLLVFKDNVDKGCGQSIVWALSGISGSHKFALQWRLTVSTPALDTGRVRSFQVIEITDASFLFSLTTSSVQSGSGGYDDLDNMDSTQTPASADSILLMVANVQMDVSGASDDVGSFQFEIGGTGEGPEALAFLDATNEGCGASLMWLKTGISASTRFVLQWDEIQQIIDVGDFVRSIQVIEITDNANLLSAITSVAADSLTGSYTDVVDLVDTVDVVDEDSILLFGACFPGGPSSDDTGQFSFFEGAVREGPEVYCFQDDSGGHEGCGHSIYWAAEGKSTGSHTFSLRGLNVTGTYPMATALRRSFTILELTSAAPAQIDKEAIDTIGLEVDETLTELFSSAEVVEDLDLAIGEAPADLQGFLERQEQLDLAIDEDAPGVEVRVEGVEGVDLAIDEQAGDVVVGLTAQDILDLAILEDVAGVMVPIEVLDDLEIAIEEGPGEVVVGIAVEDDLDLALIEVAIGFVEGTAQENLEIGLVEVVDLLGLIEIEDQIDLAIDEQAAQIAVGIEAQDDLDVEVLEGVGEIVAGIGASDVLDLEVVEVETDLLGLIQPVESLGLSLEELVDLLSAAERLDTLDLEIGEEAQVAVGISAQDVLDLALDEQSESCLVIDVEDTLSLALVDQVDLLGILALADSISLRIVEGVPLVVASLSAQDLLDLEIDEVASVQVPIEVVDSLDLGVVEDLAEIVVGIFASDLLELSVDEVAEVVGFLNREDILALDLLEDADLLAFVEAVDGLDLNLDDVVGDLCVVLTAADTMGISIEEVAQVVNLIAALESLGLEILELPGEVVGSDAFAGLLVQVIKLVQVNEARFELSVVREARIELQIEGSGEQE